MPMPSPVTVSSPDAAAAPLARAAHAAVLDAAIARAAPATTPPPPAATQSVPTPFASAPRLALVTLRVVAVDAGGPDGEAGFLVGAEGEQARAVRAAGCLIAPEIDDEVLCACGADGAVAILSVLRRAASGAATLSVAGAAGAGTVGLRITAPDLAVTTTTLDVSAGTVRARFGALHAVGETASLALHALETVAQRIQACAHDWIVRAGTALRIVDQVDSTVAETVLVQAHQTFAVQSANALLTSDKDMRIDGELISMG